LLETDVDNDKEDWTGVDDTDETCELCVTRLEADELAMALPMVADVMKDEETSFALDDVEGVGTELT
jgi:hypothetical protein